MSSAPEYQGYGAVPTTAPPLYSSASGPGANDVEARGIDSLDADFKGPVAEAPLAVRMNFVRKVYSILAAQLGLTSIVSAFCLYNEAVKEFIHAHPALLFVCLFASIGLVIAVQIYRRSYPLNMILLGIFTLVEAYTVGFVCSTYESEVVLQAAFLTFVIVIGLTLFTLQSKWDFSGMGPFLMSALLVLIGASLLRLFFPYSRAVDTGIAVIGALIFCGYIVYDTFMIFEKLSPEEYIDASIQLYLDIINLFLQLLRILGNSRD
ncbi:inhibitor of apoptosis-promoting Bax1-domain-containing protein [Zopfochytrium polystomum]|nr:inhibitor of apoptosis-promoting Bax1-domain-containing protein [Zopfochytrium polystomum]